ncbi:tetratricopeptide repeat protein [Actinokineospora sp. NBRC 105648]|uniref:tetratricopeptide repeat protein n=1 Tax=Actinokineospora sp. NBRC 105648 TaxID=3032206 RepID=UPI0024A3F047|nr:tetratricopeptide repeat protein [Actinokineospora sp. NBRC 105648]GLZ36898.1 hypothetical protein Acsp05_05230 [Actinokineospora sp. NBRC 105648]
MADEDDPRDRLAHLLHEADDLPPGLGKCESLERAARGADAAGATELGVAARLLLVNAYREIRRYDLMLTPFAWLRATEGRHPEAFDEWAVHQFTWMHKWLPTGLLGDPRFSLAQITALVDQLEQRYRLHGYSPHPVHDKRRALAHHIGDTAAADAHFAAWRAAEPDEMSDCAACVVDSQVGYFVSRERYEDAIVVARQVLDEPSDCAEQPHGVLASLIEAYLATDRLDDAARAHLLSYRVVRGTPQGRSALHAHLRFCAITGNACRGLEILGDNLDVLVDPPSPKVLQDFAAAAALLLSRVDDRAERVFAVGEREYDGEALRAHCASVARETAAEFDRRNGTDAVSVRVAKTLTTPDVATVLVAVPEQPTPADGAGPDDAPADPVVIAERACAAFDGGAMFTGSALLSRLPADLDVLLPEGLAARVAAHRTRLARYDSARAVADELTAVLDRLLAAGEHTAAARAHSTLADVLLVLGEHDQARARVAAAMALGTEHGDPVSVLHAHLTAAGLHPDDPAAATAELDAAERIATENAPERLGAVLNSRAEALAERGETAEALVVVERLLGQPWPESTRYRLSDHRADLLVALGRTADAVRARQEHVALVREVTGPWVADALLELAMLVDQAGIPGEHLDTLLEAVAAARRHLAPAGVARACLHLSAAYLTTGRDLEAAETLEEALRLMPPRFDGPLCEIRYRLALACRNLGEHQAVADHLVAVTALAGEDDPGMAAHVRHQLGNAYLQLGSLDEAAAAFRESARQWLVADAPVAASESLVKLAHARGLADLGAGLSILDEAATLVADETEEGTLDQLADVVGFRAALLAHHAHYTDALAANSRAEEFAVRLGNTEWHAFLACRAARLQLDLGAPAAAESEARRAAALLDGESDEATVGAVLGALARALEEQGKPVETDLVVRGLTERLDT